jgi:hypothetical protein
MDDDECGATDGLIGRGNRSTRRKPAQIPFCPPQIPHDLTRARPHAEEGSLAVVELLLITYNRRHGHALLYSVIHSEDAKVLLSQSVFETPRTVWRKPNRAIDTPVRCRCACREELQEVTAEETVTRESHVCRCLSAPASKLGLFSIIQTICHLRTTLSFKRFPFLSNEGTSPPWGFILWS